ncbi:MAG: hypothetical protein GYA41_02890 [Bacteroidales bacterium]|nr:hypothetical protein [Bacteroidales bacterium]
MDKLEDFILRHREDLDRHSPPEEAWEGIEKALRKSRLSTALWLSSAAMILIILGTSVVYYIVERKTSSLLEKTAGNSLYLSSDPHFTETEIYYNSLIKDLYNEAIPLLTSDPELERELNYDLSKLDTICIDIKKDLKDNVSNQEVIEALINNYRIKIRILNEMLLLLKQNDTIPDKSNDHEL